MDKNSHSSTTKTHILNFFTPSNFTLSERVLNKCKEILHFENLSHQGHSVSLIDLVRVDELLIQWNSTMSGIIPYYAIKSNPDDEIISRLQYFDCASANEIRQVLKMGKSPNHIIYANVNKRPSDITFAKKCGIRVLTADNSNEIDKILGLYPDAEIVIRIAPNDDHAANTKFSSKFGIQSKTVLFECIDKYSQHIRGFSFHIGSGQQDVNAWKNAMQLVDDAFEHVRTTCSQYIYTNMKIIDIGGGFSTDSPFELDAVYSSLENMLQKYKDKQWIAECGRYFCRDTTTLLCPVLSKSERNDGTYYVIGNSIYHSFSGIMWDKQIIRQLVEGQDGDGLKYGTIVGETCDGIDVIYKGFLPNSIEIGDIFIVPHMGAYCESTANYFNGFSPAKKEYLED